MNASRIAAFPETLTWQRVRRALSGTLALLLLALTVTSAPTASAAPGDIGYQGASFSGATAPTGEKPESKLWFNDGRWWASMFQPSGGNWRIFYLNRSVSPEVWVDTGTVIDDRANSSSDALWAANGKLYVGSHVKATSSTGAIPGKPSRLYRYSYNSATRTYSLDAGFPTNINNTSSETLTLDQDSSGTLWASWTAQNQVFVNATTTNDQWGTPFVLPVADAANLDPDDISSLVAFRDGVAVMWSSQSTSAVYFSLHKNGAPQTTWQTRERTTVLGGGQADDHLNVKDLQTDGTGRIWAVIKTSLDNAGAAAPQIVVLSRASGGGWSRATFGTVGDCHTRPILMLDSTNNLVHVYATAPDSGCPFTGSAGSIFEKTSPMGNLSFSSGRGTPVMRDAASPNLNNVTGSKRTVDASTGMVLLAANDVTKRYWTSDQSLGAPTPAPAANFTATPTSGTAPLTVQFTDSSTGTPTSWAWDFGDGATSTSKSPSHTYTSAGTYTVKLTATNGSGSNSVTKSNLISVSSTPTGIQVLASTSNFSSTTSSTVSLARPAGATAGDLLVASITADLNPTLSAPAGWTPIVNALSVKAVRPEEHESSPTTGWSGHPTRRPTAGRSALPRKWGGGVTAYTGVNNTTPLDSAVATAVDTTYAATSITVASITTATNAALLIGGLGIDSVQPAVTPPTGWTERWEAAGGQVAEQADRIQDTAGATGTATWTLSSGRAMSGWRTALKPAP